MRDDLKEPRFHFVPFRRFVFAPSFASSGLRDFRDFECLATGLILVAYLTKSLRHAVVGRLNEAQEILSLFFSACRGLGKALLTT